MCVGFVFEGYNYWMKKIFGIRRQCCETESTTIEIGFCHSAVTSSAPSHHPLTTNRSRQALRLESRKKTMAEKSRTLFYASLLSLVRLTVEGLR